MEQHTPAAFGPLLTHLPEYRQDAKEVAFLLGGIGTGNVSVGARGELRDWELFNRPGKGNKFPYSFFAIHTERAGEKCTRVLEAELNEPYSPSHGIDSADIGGLPRMQRSKFRAEYPLMQVTFEEKELPVQVALEAYTPFIPLDADNSGIPAAILRYRVTNPGTQPVFVAVAGSLANMTTAHGSNDFHYVTYAGETRNVFHQSGALTGVQFESVGFAPEHPMHANMALVTTNPESTVKPLWYQGAWFDGIQDFWDDFTEDGLVARDNTQGGEGNTLMELKRQRVGSVAPHHTLQPGEEYVFEFVLSWYFPNRIQAWSQDYNPEDLSDKRIVRNHYALKFASAWDAAEYLVAHLPELEEHTLKFHQALFGSTLPVEVLDAVSANITVLRSTTCFWLENGTFMGWEGCFDKAGCCDGTCTHVWNYAQTLAFLFPKLEQTMRYNEFRLETDATGKMNFRNRKLLGDEEWKMHPAADGQTGTIVRLYREWKLSGDNSLIDEMGPAALRALDFSIAYWDADGDGVLDSQQHNTYDIEFYGPNSLTNTMFYAALKAGVAIAEYLEQPERAQEYEKKWRMGSQRMDEMLWSGEYYVQRLDDIDRYKYQYGIGCLSDQILGQYMAHVAGLGYILPEDHIKQTAKSIYQYNFEKDFRHHSNVQRTYALNDEAGLLLCSWPHGGRPRFPFVYCDEVWTGIEYQVAATLAYEGFVEESVELVRAVRARHDGYRRNPFNEVECGHHYARAMASWAMLTALSGFEYDMTRDQMSFAPKVNQDDFSCFFCTGKGWGVYRQKKNDQGELETSTEMLYRPE